jgi:hypothetical protein
MLTMSMRYSGDLIALGKRGNQNLVMVVFDSCCCCLIDLFVQFCPSDLLSSCFVNYFSHFLYLYQCRHQWISVKYFFVIIVKLKRYSKEFEIYYIWWNSSFTANRTRLGRLPVSSLCCDSFCIRFMWADVLTLWRYKVRATTVHAGGINIQHTYAPHNIIQSEMCLARLNTFTFLHTLNYRLFNSRLRKG